MKAQGPTYSKDIRTTPASWRCVSASLVVELERSDRRLADQSSAFGDHFGQCFLCRSEGINQDQSYTSHVANTFERLL